jgi:hypothetical protein
MDSARRWWAAFGRWRRSRPFWGGALILLGAGIILSIPVAGSSLGVVFTEGIAGISGVLIALMLAVAGLTCWVSPSARVFAGIAACFLAIVAVVTSNLGGFLFGTIDGVIGGAMAVAWSPDPVVKTPRGHKKAIRKTSPAQAEPVLAGVGAGAAAAPAASYAGPSAPAPQVIDQGTAVPVGPVTGEALFDPFPDAGFAPPSSEVETGHGQSVPDEIFPSSDQPDPRWGFGGRGQDGGISRVVAIGFALLALIVTPLAATASAHPAAQRPGDLISQVFATARNPTTISASYNQTGGTNYEGVGTYDGKTVLKFRFDSDDIDNMDMRSNNHDPNAPDVDITATKAHLAGNMEFYATSLSGSLFGLIPATFTPAFPPPITLPTLILTNFSASVVFIRVDDMQLQGLNLTVLPNGA